MKPRDLFGVLVRGGGLWVAWYGFYDALYAIIERMGLLPTAQISAQTHALYAFVYFVLAIIVIRTADHIVNFAYEGSREPVEGSSRDSDSGA